MSNFEFRMSNEISQFDIRHSTFDIPLLLFLGLVTGSLRADLSETRKILGLDLRRGAVFAPDGVIDFLAMDADLFGSVDPEADFVAADIHDGHLDVIPDHDRLVALTG